MSTEARLARLGLLHLKDDPVALEKAMAAKTAEHEAAVAAWHKKRDAIRAQKKAAAKAPAPPAQEDPLAERVRGLMGEEEAVAFLAAVKTQPSLLGLLDTLEQALNRISELESKRKR